MWQPSAGWQTLTPDVPYGAQRRLQQSPQPLHTVPSTPPLQNDAPAGGAPQVPSVAPAAIVQTPPQQSGPCAQVSPPWMQNDEAIEQWPVASQSCEQHSELAVHALPDVLQDLLSAWHVPPVQVPPQQSVPVMHACPSEAQACAAHLPLTQEREQHSSEPVHAAPAASQLTGAPPRHVFARGSHRSEQQSASLPQCDPVSAQALVPNPTPPSADTAAEESAAPIGQCRNDPTQEHEGGDRVLGDWRNGHS